MTPFDWWSRFTNPRRRNPRGVEPRSRFHTSSDRTNNFSCRSALRSTSRVLSGKEEEETAPSECVRERRSESYMRMSRYSRRFLQLSSTAAIQNHHGTAHVQRFPEALSSDVHAIPRRIRLKTLYTLRFPKNVFRKYLPSVRKRRS